MEITLAIIGTAGRKDDANRLSRDSFGGMCVVAEELLEQLKESNYPVSHAVSGGAAWADHVAVKLFLNKKVDNLRLFIPCEFVNGKFEDKLSVRLPLPAAADSRFSPGSTLNHYHAAFQRKANINSLSEIAIAQSQGAEILPCRGGFHGRNAMVAKSDILLAMTFGEGNMVKEGGTANTVRRYLARVEKENFFNKSFHFNLFDGKIYTNISVPQLKKTPK